LGLGGPNEYHPYEAADAPVGRCAKNAPWKTAGRGAGRFE